MKEAKTGLTKQEMMRIFEEQIELKNAEIERLEGENKKLQESIDVLLEVVWNQSEKIAFLEGVLEGIRKLDGAACNVGKEKCCDYVPFDASKCKHCDIAILRMKLGVLLKEAKNK